MKAFFITGTDTGVGKTVVAGLAGRFLLDKGYSVITKKIHKSVPSLGMPVYF